MLPFVTCGEVFSAGSRGMAALPGEGPFDEAAFVGGERGLDLFGELRVAPLGAVDVHPALADELRAAGLAAVDLQAFEKRHLPAALHRYSTPRPADLSRWVVGSVAEDRRSPWVDSVNADRGGFIFSALTTRTAFVPSRQKLTERDTQFASAIWYTFHPTTGARKMNTMRQYFVCIASVCRLIHLCIAQ